MNHERLIQREFRNEVVRLADLTVNTDRVVDRSFEGCQILGPAVIVPLDGTEISFCSFDGPDMDAVIWEIPASRPAVVGAIAVVQCRFFRCGFVRVGVAVPEQQADAVRRGLGMGG